MINMIDTIFLLEKSSFQCTYFNTKDRLFVYYLLIIVVLSA